MTQKRKRINIPMILTWARIVFIPLIIAIFYVPQSWISVHAINVLACSMFAVAAITDALDGFLARRLKMETRQGAFLDAVADKLIVCSAVIVLLHVGRIPMILALIIIGREITVTALREWMAQIGASRVVRVNRFGKIKTIVQMFAIGMLLFFDPFYGINIGEIGLVLIWIAAAVTVYSMCVYLSAAWPHIEKEDDQPLN